MMRPTIGLLLVLLVLISAVTLFAEIAAYQDSDSDAVHAVPVSQKMPLPSLRDPIWKSADIATALVTLAVGGTRIPTLATGTHVLVVRPYGSDVYMGNIADLATDPLPIGYRLASGETYILNFATTTPNVYWMPFQTPATMSQGMNW